MCKYTFIKYAGDKGIAKSTGGAIFNTECNNSIYGLELTKGNCIYCNQLIEVNIKLDPLHRRFTK